MSQVAKQKKTVLVFGVFDLLHPGHRYFLKQANKFGWRLLVVVARDQIAKKLKGSTPVQNEKIRLQQISKLTYVTKAYLGNTNVRHNFAMVKKLQPQIIALGYDQYPNSIRVLKNKLKQQGIKTKIIRMKPYQITIYKSSLLKNRPKPLSKHIDKSVNTNYHNSTNNFSF